MSVLYQVCVTSLVNTAIAKGGQTIWDEFFETKLTAMTLAYLLIHFPHNVQAMQLYSDLGNDTHYPK